MSRKKLRQQQYDEDRVRVLWNRHETYDELGAIAVGGRVVPLRVAFFDRETGIAPVVPQIAGGCTVRAWPRSKQATNLGDMALSVDDLDRRAAQTIIATRASGAWLDTSKEVHVYFLTAPDSECTSRLPDAIPPGDYVSGVGHSNLAVTWDQLVQARDCANLRSEGDVIGRTGEER